MELRVAVVVRVAEERCEVWGAGRVEVVGFTERFPRPRVERVSPGHLVAVTPDGTVVWRWYDAVVLGAEGDGLVRLWEPGHGEVVAATRPSYRPVEPGRRAWASAGLPGADWWVAGPADGAEVELDAVAELMSGGR